MTQLHIPIKKVVDQSYNIEIGFHLFDALINDLKSDLVTGVNKYAIITDSKVKDIYGDQLLEKMKQQGFDVELFSFPSGETSKTRQTKASIEDQMLEKSFGRDSCIIAIGGGAVTDLAGFVAGTFSRGIPCINYATTLLAAADASVGGKTAVNTPVATNLIGVFHQPEKVYIDLATWSTLPVRELRSGLAETIKHACLADEDFFVYLEENIEKIVSTDGGLLLNQAVCEHIAFKNCEIKYSVVEKDEMETNLRQILNLGHTAGRALEALSGYQLFHGEAVAIGLVIQAKLGQRLNFLLEEDVNRIIFLLKRSGLPTQMPSNISHEDRKAHV